MGDLVFIGDVHLDRGDPEVDAFVALLDALGETASRIVLMGDLFNLWIGRRELEQAHHSRVLERFVALRKRGVKIRYVEGNRDYFIAGDYAGSALDDATDRGIVETFGGHTIAAIHGDLSNVHDRQYRTWRRVSRSRLVQGLFHLVPRGRRMALAERLERSMRTSNREYKREFPEAQVRRYAAEFLLDGADLVVLGHFHIERDLVAEPPSPPGRIIVLPEWKPTRRHLRVAPDGEIAFVEFRG